MIKGINYGLMGLKGTVDKGFSFCFMGQTGGPTYG
jgi:hypothetical protein